MRIFRNLYIDQQLNKLLYILNILIILIIYTYFKNKLESTLFSEEKIAKYCDFQSYGNTLLLIALIVISVFCVLIIIGLIVIVITQRKKMKENNNNGVKDLKSEAIMPKDEL